MERLEAYSNIAAVSTVAKICNIIVRSDEEHYQGRAGKIHRVQQIPSPSMWIHSLSSEFITQISLRINPMAAEPPVLKLNKDCGVVVAIDLGITSLHVGICNIMGEPLCEMH